MDVIFVIIVGVITILVIIVQKKDISNKKQNLSEEKHDLLDQNLKGEMARMKDKTYGMKEKYRL